MNTYSFTFYTMSDCCQTAYIKADSVNEAEKKFWDSYKDCVDTFYKVYITISN
jgi:hypothetical protein